MKFSKRSARHLDDYNSSGIMISVTFKTDPWGNGHYKSHTPEVMLQLLDCSNRSQIHDFGSTREKQLRKVNVLINELEKLRMYINHGWDAYDRFWKNREEDQ